MPIREQLGAPLGQAVLDGNHDNAMLPNEAQLGSVLLGRVPPEVVTGSTEVLALGRGAPLPEARRVPVQEQVAGFARTQGACIAVQCGARSIDYRGLDAWAGLIARQLAAVGVGRGCRVGIVAEPSIAMVAGALGILRAGAAYVPVDLAQPDRRIADIVADARMAAAVVTGAAQARLAGSTLPIIQIADVFDDEGAIEAPHGTSPVPVLPEDAAYLIYTSGSTGEPKGVVVEHGQLAASTLARRCVYPGAASFLLVSPLAFDSSVAGLWGTLTTGGRLVVATSDEVRDPQRLVELVETRQVARLLCVPSLYSVLLDAAERLGPARLGSLDTVIVAGESLSESLLKRHFAILDNAVLVNEYGPTEATVWASYRWFDEPGPVSIGGPTPGAALYVLDERLRPVPRGVEGELFIGGAGVSRGYFGRPEATAGAFVEDPFANVDGARMYRTGDLARWNDEGTLDFLGRRDHQVKIRGHRVELGVVEAALLALPGVREAVVVPDRDRTRLVAFVRLGGGAALAVPAAGATAPGSIRALVAQRLPAVMVPAQIRVLDRFPRTVNGKVDRDALRAAADDPVPAPGAAVDLEVNGGNVNGGNVNAGEVDGGLAAQVAAAWTQVLRVSSVPADVNFFDLGGNSLTMYHLQDALESHTGTRPSVVALFRHTTVSAQTALIRDGGGSPDESVPSMRDAAARRAHALRARQQRAEREATL